MLWGGHWCSRFTHLERKLPFLIHISLVSLHAVLASYYRNGTAPFLIYIVGTVRSHFKKRKKAFRKYKSGTIPVPDGNIFFPKSIPTLIFFFLNG